MPVSGHNKSPRGVVVGDEDPGGYLEYRDKDLPEIASAVDGRGVKGERSKGDTVSEVRTAVVQIVGDLE